MAPPKIGYQAINAAVKMPASSETVDRTKLERTADTCPIKHSFDPGVEVKVVSEYPD